MHPLQGNRPVLQTSDIVEYLTMTSAHRKRNVYNGAIAPIGRRSHRPVLQTSGIVEYLTMTSAHRKRNVYNGAIAPIGRRSHRPKCNRYELRKGTVAVEFAVLMPILLTFLFGIVEIGRGYDVSHVMTLAVREGARFGAMDKVGMLAENQTANDKMVSDIRVFLTASGLPGNVATINITTVPDAPGGSTSAFAVDDPANNLELFQIEVTLPYASVSHMPATFLKDRNLVVRIVFRNARSTLVD